MSGLGMRLSQSQLYNHNWNHVSRLSFWKTDDNYVLIRTRTFLPCNFQMRPMLNKPMSVCRSTDKNFINICQENKDFYFRQSGLTQFCQTAQIDCFLPAYHLLDMLLLISIEVIYLLLCLLGGKFLNHLKNLELKV